MCSPFQPYSYMWLESRTLNRAIERENMKFEELTIGQTFDFVSAYPTLCSFFEPCRKIDTLHYVAMNADGSDNTRYGTMRVGSASVDVWHVGRKP